MHSRRLAFIVLVLGSALPLQAQQVLPQTHVQITGDQFTYKGTVYRIKGTNYYPQSHMWASMWSNWDWTEITTEIPLIRNLGMNAVRILVPYSQGGWNGANVPASRLQMLEDIVNEMGRNGIRSCVTLFDWETSFPAAGTSTETNHITYLNAIVNRLKNNPYVLCWDVKNEPDHPSNLGNNLDNWDASPNKAKIVSWLNRMCNAVKARDPNHGVSAGIRWWTNVKDVIAFEDIAMFHSYWPNIGSEEIPTVKGYMGSNQKPILVEEFGWPSNPTPGLNGGVLVYSYTEADQLNFYTTHLTAFAQHNIAGGIQWMTFDASVYSGSSSESFENHFGLWRFDQTLKPGGAYYRDNFPVSLFPVEPDGAAPGVVTNFRATARSTDILLAWSAPSDIDYTGVLIRCSTTATPNSVTDGTLLADLPGTRLNTGTYVHRDMLYHTRYYYAAFARDTSGNYSARATATVVSPTPGDFDRDGDIDMADFSHLQTCYSGHAIPQNKSTCQDALLDSDSDVDAADLSILLNCLSGRANPVAADCAQ